MTDRALANAEKRRDELAAEINKINQELEGLRRELSRVSEFIENWYSFAGTKQDSLPLGEANQGVNTSYPQDRMASAPRVGESEKPITPKNPDKEVVGQYAKAIILEKLHPMPRTELFNELARRGIKIHGKDPEMVLSTMMWRMQDDFIRLPKHGYWIRSLHWAPANYKPGDNPSDADSNLEEMAVKLKWPSTLRKTEHQGGRG